MSGTPVSQQCRRQATLRSWKDRVSRDARKERPEAVPFEGDVTVRIAYYYFDRGMDLDNLSKPICDALKKVIYLDDGQITDLYAAKRDLNRLVATAGVTDVLSKALQTTKEFIHVTIDFSTTVNSPV